MARLNLKNSRDLLFLTDITNIECIKTLITIAHTDGNYLGNNINKFRNLGLLYS